MVGVKQPWRESLDWRPITDAPPITSIHHHYNFFVDSFPRFHPDQILVFILSLPYLKFFINLTHFDYHTCTKGQGNTQITQFFNSKSLFFIDNIGIIKILPNIS